MWKPHPGRVVPSNSIRVEHDTLYKYDTGVSSSELIIERKGVLLTSFTLHWEHQISLLHICRCCNFNSCFWPLKQLARPEVSSSGSGRTSRPPILPSCLILILPCTGARSTPCACLSNPTQVSALYVFVFGEPPRTSDAKQSEGAREV